jgi:hypothetical protein
MGTTLRAFLSEKLNCDPMRITKKFTGDHSIGKQMYTPAQGADEEVLKSVQKGLMELEAKFIAGVAPTVSILPFTLFFPFHVHIVTV